MGKRRTDPELLIEALKVEPSNQASPRRMSELLGWEIEKVQRAVVRAQDELQAAVDVGPGGVIKYFGNETSAENPLYRDVSRVIRDYWGPREFGLKQIDVIRTAKSGTRGFGSWTHPDLVVAANPSRRDSASEPRRLHAIEVENKDGFDVRSVYQAHAQSRGADYTWVFGNKSPGVEDETWNRVRWTAQELGVGLVTFGKAGSFGTWAPIWNRAERKFPTAKERDDFINLAIGPILRTEYDL